jgi:DNA mismatch repair protein MutS2
MQPSVLKALEFDRIREALAHEALTPLGRARAMALDPATDPDLVETALRLTTEAVAFAGVGGSLAIVAPEDLEAVLGTLDVADQPLEPLMLLGLARFVESVDHVATTVRRHAAGAAGESIAPGLLAIAQHSASFIDEVGAVRRAIEPSGDVSDRASPALAEIREKLRRQRARLRSSLESLTRGRDTAKYLQDQIITDRNGRYVVVVRAEHRDSIPGIVHGSSASGASLYLEPLATVELNNDVVALADREKQEIRRILLVLSNAFRLRDEELGATFDVAADLDELHAKVSLARRVDGVAPGITSDGRLEFLAARHPLLIPAVRDLLEDGPKGGGPRTVVGSDLVLIPPARALVISGPNTGGKTVALKATGLLALMAQSGLLLPVAPGSRFTPFRTIFADIGDEQSISASLSTFSAHIANIVAMDRALELPALMLLDEVGSGTDPAEGSALGTAIIDHFRRRGAVVMATTHDDALKSYAATTEGVLTAGFGFNPLTYAPTYRLMYGAPGRSLALEIALRLGLPADVIADARSRRTSREALLAAHLSRVDHELAALARDRATVEEDRGAVAAQRQRLLDHESRLTEREAILKKRTEDRMNEKLREARLEVDRIVGQLKIKADTLSEEVGRRSVLRGSVLSTGEVGDLRAEARSALGAVGDAVGASDTPHDSQALSEPPVVNQRVFVPAFGAEGIVRAVLGKQVEVEVRGKRLKVPLAGLEMPQGARQLGDSPRPTAQGARPIPAQRRTEQTDRLTAQSARETLGGPVPDLVVIGCTVDEALTRAEKFLDDGLLADARRLRIVHGHGTGRLREALTRFFREHPLVADVSPAGDHEGGRGAMILELRD